MDLHAYLQRIGYRGPLEPTPATLAALHRAHLLSVPFENLDIHLGRPIVLALPALYAKIVAGRRGGFCYELNGLFAWLLRELGFEVELLSARVFEQGLEGPEFDHLALAVRMNAGWSADTGREVDGGWLADVGFGDSFLEPLRMRGGDENAQDSGTFRLTKAIVERLGDPGGEGTGAPRADLVLERSRPAGAPWEPQYVFSMAPRVLSDFDAMCRFHQTSPRSSFTRRTICSRATPRGRVTLSNQRRIVTDDGQRGECPIATAAEYRRVLRGEFGIQLGGDVDLDRLRVPRTPGGAED